MSTNEDRYFDLNEEYGLKHYQLPKVFFTSELYHHLKLDDMVAWAILRDRFSISKKNGWYEKYGNGKQRVFFIYKNSELMKVLGIKSETTLTRIKKHLEQANLLEQKRMGLNTPNRLYLLKPTVTDADIYKIDKLEEVPDKKDYANPKPPKAKKQESANNGTPNNEVPSQNAPNIGTPNNEVPKIVNGTPNNEVLELQKMESSNTNSSYSSLSKETVNTDTYKETEPRPDSQKFEQDKLLKESLKDSIPEKTHHTLCIFTENFDEMHRWFGIILRAKSKVEKERGFLLLLDDIDFELNDILMSCIRVIKRKTKKIDSPDNYLYKTMYYELSKLAYNLEVGSNEAAATTERPNLFD
ncbi:MAG: replication initiator protein [Neobacillus sp.]|nr:replication initiator protein [Neobacillus sp.]